MRRHIAEIVLIGISAVSLSASSKASDQASESCRLSPVMVENFDEQTAPNRRIESISSNRIGPARWTAHTPWSGDFGDARFGDPGPHGPFRMANGILSITASRDHDGKWMSGLIAAADATGTGTGTRYGYFEARMKMPPGPGVWPAFWLAALKPVSQRDGNVEIDVIEYYGQFNSAYQSVVHVWFNDAAKNRGQNQKIEVPSNSLVDDFHTFGVDISPQNIVFFRDGKETWRQPTPHELDGPLYPLVNLALGGGWPIDGTLNPSVLQVDYVHVYSRQAGPPEGCPPGLP